MTKVNPKVFLNFFKSEGVDFFTGVPDSLLKNFTNCLFENIDKKNIIAPNEGSAVGLAIGSYLSTQKTPLVYMQNSGLGNALNPIISLADQKVMSIPMILLIGWRGEIDEIGNQIKDEPQHITQGKVTINFLKTLNIPYHIISRNLNYKQIKQLIQACKKYSKPVALVVRKDIFEEYKLKEDRSNKALTREVAINQILKSRPPNTILVSTTGMTSRELYEIREMRLENHDQDFLTVGGMGHAISIAIGIANSTPDDTRTLCLDGDGALIMHMGVLPYAGRQKNLIHILFNNEAHDSVGGQATIAGELNLCKIAKECNFDFAYKVTDKDSLNYVLKKSFESKNQSIFIEIECLKGYRSDLGRPKKTPLENKVEFMSFLKTKF